MNKRAFTLAEVLITLGVIGVVAAITMPVLMTNINERVNSERQANIVYKITQAMEQMRAHGKLVQYADTDAFVDELQKYLKIAKRCNADHIAECWTTDTITTSDGEEFKISDCKTRKNLLPGSETNGNNVGLILADGASIILTYNPNANPIDIGDPITTDSEHLLPIGNNKYKNFPYTTSVTNAIDFVMDVNGKTGPNREKIGDKWNDIRTFKGAKFTPGCVGGIQVAGVGCVINLGTSYGTVGTYIEYDGSTVPDAYLGAVKACRDIGMELTDRSTKEKLCALSDQYPGLQGGWVYGTDAAGTTADYSWCSNKSLGTGWNHRQRHDFAAICVKN